MTTGPALRVRVDDTAHSRQIGEVLASLPVSLRPAGATAELVAVGGEPGWPARTMAAIGGGALGILVVDPAVEDIDQLSEVAANSGVPIVIDRPFAGNPAIPVAAEWFSRNADPAELIESRMTVPMGTDLNRSAMDQFSLIRATAGALDACQPLIWNASGYVLHGRVTDGRRTVLSATTTDAVPRSAWLRALRPAGAVELLLPDPATARPAQATVTATDGATLLPTVYETAHRAAWRRLHRLVTETGEPPADLSDLAADMHLTGRWITARPAEQ